MMTNEIKQVAQQVAEQAGLGNWLDRDSLNSGWYTCILTGKKMRSKAAEEQFAKQDVAMDKFAKVEAQPLEDRPVVTDDAGKQGQLPTGSGEGGQILPDDIEFKSGPLARPASNRTLTDEEIVAKVEAAGGDAGVLSKSEYDRYVFMQTSMSARLFEHTAGGMAMAGKKFVKINCADCNTERTIKVQDQFQVTRCVDCQRKHRNRIRAARRKVKKEQ